MVIDNISFSMSAWETIGWTLARCVISIPPQKSVDNSVKLYRTLLAHVAALLHLSLLEEIVRSKLLCTENYLREGFKQDYRVTSLSIIGFILIVLNILTFQVTYVDVPDPLKKFAHQRFLKKITFF